tara:strand:+ start:620 stop:1051 length:432 start_codon:yes stop_codon:yes gene_type:complete
MTLKRIATGFCIFLLALFVTGCKTTETTKSVQRLAGEVVAIKDICKHFETQMTLYKEFRKSFKKGHKLYTDLLYHEECIIFPKHILAKRVKLEFTGKYTKEFDIEIWKVVLDETVKKGQAITFFWTAVQKEIKQSPKGSKVAI